MPSSVYVGGRRYTNADLDALLAALTARPQSNVCLIAHAADRLAFLAALRLGAATECAVLAAPSYWTEVQIRAAVERWQPSMQLRTRAGTNELVIEALGTAAGSTCDPGLVIFSSGTTGVPKAISHTWASASVSGGFVPERLFRRRWYLAYEPASYAGLQVHYSALQSEGALVLPPSQASFSAHAESIVGHRIDVISATPTWWRLLVSAWPEALPVPRLHQATMGGELVDQPTLDLVDGFFKPEHLTHIYATSEVGTAVVVSDRQAGFPAELLGTKRQVELRVRDGVLEVRSPFRMSRYLDGGAASPSQDGFIRTGDLVEMRQQRCYFAGREDQQLNIGGVKVAPEQIESVVLAYPEVRDCVVYGRPNPIVGVLPSLDVVPVCSDSFDIEALRQNLRRDLPPHVIPKYIRLVDHIQVTSSGKKQRQ
jgi:acyl-coenzyme A synthetase/AMP-(fatty) acid ligase